MDRSLPAKALKLRITVVDDDSAVRDSLKFALELEGWAVETRSSGRALLDDMPAADCLILDYRMPDMDGIAVMGVLAERHKSIPTILITAPLTAAVKTAARQAGAFSILEKPLTDGKLVENIRHATRA
jgi:FixJ family two-component response regulator